MSILKKSISSLSQKEIINYKLYANRINKDKNRKDIKLFESIRKQKNDDSNDIDLFEKLYSEKTPRNVYAQLRTRLLTEINNSLVQFYFHETDTHYVYSELSLYKIYYAKNEWEVAHYHLLKAETRAVKIQDFVMLYVIYMEFINLSNHYDAISPDIYIKKREENDLKLNDLKLLDDLITTITYQLKRDQNFSKKRNEVVSLLNTTIKQLSEKPEIRDNLIFKSKLYSANCLLLLSKQNYTALGDYSIKTYNEFTKQKLFSKNNHNLKLQMLCYVCNALCANGDHNRALQYLEHFKHSMLEFKNLYYDNYAFFYYNSLANNYIILNPSKAIQVLDEASEIKAIKNHPRHLSYIYLSLAGVYFDLKKHKAGLNNIVKLYNNPAFSMFDDSFKINITIIEIVLQLELKKSTQAQELINNLLENYKSIFSSEEYLQEFDFLSLLNNLISQFNFKSIDKSKELVKNFCKKTYKFPRNSIINYNYWLEENFN